MKDYCKYVDVFYGNGEVDHFAKKGPASKWYYIKALCGNTIPHATLPFGKMSVGPYSGGYPTGYGNHFPNSCGGIKKLYGTNMASGFSHLHQSGTGAMRYYYNYAIIQPYEYDWIPVSREFSPLTNEKAHPGYYSCNLGDIGCEFTVSGAVALHRYRYKNKNGKLFIDFFNNGLSRVFDSGYHGTVSDAEINIIDDNHIACSVILSGIRLYFCTEIQGKGIRTKIHSDAVVSQERIKKFSDFSAEHGVIVQSHDDEIKVKISYSTVSAEAAWKNINEVKTDFDETAEEAYRIWNEHLSAINIATRSKAIRERFYSALYHSLIKPADMQGEEVLGIKGDLVTDLATLWDQYKTLYPLIYTFYPDMGQKLVKGIANISRTLGKIPCSLGLSDIFPCEEQAKMLGIFALTDAWYASVEGADSELIDECIKRELDREDFKIFLKKGIFQRYTHILDTTDTCINVAAITKNRQLKKRLLKLSENWKNAYSSEDGLMSEDSPYYEGDRYTYSFRLQANMEERIALAGGKEKFVEMLDSFFGFGKESLKQETRIGVDPAKVGAEHHRFEGFNNECDMETPYAYIYADRNDRTCEIVHASIKDSFLSGRGGLPGNNDSGGLTSCYIWNVLGIFPVTGQGEFLIGSPHIERATLNLSSGKILEIEVKGRGSDKYIAESAEFDGKKVENFRIKTAELMKGGKLIINMK